jgi:hypothetical protein
VRRRRGRALAAHASSTRSRGTDRARRARRTPDARTSWPLASRAVARVGPPDWPGGDEAWRAFRAKEPVNAHSHLIQVLMGTSESIPVSAGLLKIGRYQNVIVIDADGPIDGPNKKRTIAVQVMGASA